MAQESLFEGIIRSLGRNKGKALLILLISLFFTVILNRVHPPVFEGRSLLRIMTTETDAGNSLAASMNGLLAQRSVVREVIKSCGLDGSFQPTGEPFVFEDAGPGLVKLSVRHSNPGVIKNMGESLVKVLSEQFLGFSSEALQFELEALEGKRKVLLGKIKEARAGWAKANLQPNDESVQDDSRSLLEAEIDILQSEIDADRTKLGTMPRILVVASKQMTQEYEKANSALKKARNNLAELLKTYREKHPKVIEADRKIATLESSLKAVSRKRDQEMVNGEYLALQARIEEREGKIAELKDRMKIAGTMIAHADENALSPAALTVRLKNLEELYNDVLKNIEEINLKHNAAVGRIQVLKNHTTEPDPVGFSGSQRIFMGLMCGALISVFLLYVPNPVKAEFVMPAAAMMNPGMFPGGDHRGMTDILQIPVLNTERLALPEPDSFAELTRYDDRLIALNDPGSKALEPFRTLLSNLQIVIAESQTRIIIVGSARHGMGRTTLAANIGVLLAQNAYSVVLVDADMRKPALHKVFDVESDKGLSTLLCGNGSIGMVQQTCVKNLGILPAGPMPPNPAELLGSFRMIELLESLRRRVEIIIIDTPPLLEFPDAGIIASNLGGVVYLHKDGEAEADMVAGRDFLKNIRANVIGYVTT